MSDRVRIGDLLVAAKLVTAEQVQEALVAQRETGRRLGEELVAKGFVTEFQLTQILSNQLSIPWVSLQRIEFTRELLNMVPAEVANRLCVIPIYMRRVRQAETLYVAMDDPTNEPALEELALTTGLPVKAMVSSPSEIRHAIRVYYLGGAPQVHPPERRASRHPDAPAAAPDPVSIPKAPPTGLGGTSLPATADEWETGVQAPPPSPATGAQPVEHAANAEAGPGAGAPMTGAAPATPPASAATAAPDTAGHGAGAESPAAGASSAGAGATSASVAADAAGASTTALSPPTSAANPAVPAGPAALAKLAAAGPPEPAPVAPEPDANEAAEEPGVKMVTLTLLDGTTVRLPAPGSKRRNAEPSTEGGLTASDLVSALVARAQGADVSDVLPDQQWEVLFASLLTLLIRKGLLADWEFVEEWKKRQGS